MAHTNPYPPYIKNCAKQLGKKLANKNHTISVAESFTGGLITSSIVDIEGSSSYFDTGFITYSIQSKIKHLKIEKKLIEKHGVVSIIAAKQMAKQVQNITGSSIGASSTGFAGSTGGNKPVGFVCFGIAIEKRLIGFSKQLKGSRLSIRLQSTLLILNYLNTLLND